MAIKKSELYSKLWASCDELRGGMDASQYKDYVLVLLFVKYVSDKYAGKKDSLIDIPKGGHFNDMIAAKGDKEIGDKINKIISKLAAANDLKGVIDVADFNDPEKLGKAKEMVDRLSKLVAIFESLEFGANRADGDDLLGDAYEYLMQHFATESGKSKGQFYTPAEVSQIMAKVIGIRDAKSASQTIYDPTCGSGSLLLKAYDETKKDLSIYGQEMDVATAALAKMNMILHDCPTAEIWKDNTLSSPYFKEKNGKLKTFDFVVANPPFSTSAWTSGFDPGNDQFSRFEYGIPPEKNGDFAFLLHIISSLKSDGKGACILPHGVLFRGGAESIIRKAIINQGFIKGIISLPANLFYGTGIPACIIVLDKENSSKRKEIFMIDASKDFIKDGNKNRLRAQDIHKIVDTFNNQIKDDPKYARMVTVNEISDQKNDYNLNIPRYIDSAELEDVQDIEAHLKGGVPNNDINALGKFWELFPNLKSSLFNPSRRVGYSTLNVDIPNIKDTIFEHTEFIAFNETSKKRFMKWKKDHIEYLKEIKKGDHAKSLIEMLSEGILKSFHKSKLIDPYDMYQHLMDYWYHVMQDDVYQIIQNGWKGLLDNKPNTDLIPEKFIVDSYFQVEQKEIEKLEFERDAISRLMEDMDEEHGGEEGYLTEAKNEKGKVTRSTLKTRLQELKKDALAAEEIKILNDYSALIEQEYYANKMIKDAQKLLDERVKLHYSKLKPEEIKLIVIEHKWLKSIEKSVHAELDRVSQILSGRIKILAERYHETLPCLIKDVDNHSLKVDAHLRKMGFSWK